MRNENSIKCMIILSKLKEILNRKRDDVLFNQLNNRLNVLPAQINSKKVKLKSFHQYHNKLDQEKVTRLILAVISLLSVKKMKIGI